MHSAKGKVPEKLDREVLRPDMFRVKVLKENDWRMKIRPNNIEQIWASENFRNFKF